MNILKGVGVALAITASFSSATSAQSQVYNFTTIAGVAPSSSTDGTNSDARFKWPNGLAVDGRGNVYVADSGNNTIRKLTPAGTNWVSSTIAGLAQLGPYNITVAGSADGTNSDARFNGPRRVAVDAAGNVYVADSGNSTVRKLTPVGTNWISSTIAGLAGSQGSADGTNSAVRFKFPGGLAVDASGNVYVTDSGNATIRKLTQVGTNWVSSTIAGLAGSTGSADGTNSNVRFKGPRGVAVDAAGNLYVADWDNSTIRKLTPAGTNWVSSTIAGLAGVGGTSDGTNSDVRFNGTDGVAVDCAGNVYVADPYNASIRRLTPVGTNWVSSTIAGLAGGAGSDDGTNSYARFDYPEDVAVQPAGNVYVADSFNSTIRKLTPVGTNWVSSTIAGLAGSLGTADGTNSNIRFSRPLDVALDGAGNVYVADFNFTIRKLTAIGTNWVSSTIAGVPFERDIAVDGGGNVYVSAFYFNNSPGVDSIHRLTPVGTNWVSSLIAGLDGSAGSSDGTNSDARFSNPTGLAVDGAGDVYVADTDSSTIRKLTPLGTNWVSSTTAGLAGVQGSVDGTNGDVQFSYPEGVAVDTAGNIYVADSGNSTIRKLTPLGTNWVSSTIAGLAGVQGSIDGTNSDARFAYPEGVAVDTSGNVYVADSGNSTIRKLTPVGTNWVSSTIGGLAGNPGSADGTNSAARFAVYSPNRVAVDGSGNVYVADTYNDTIREGIPLAVVPLPPTFQTIVHANGLITFTWSATAGRRYQLQYNPELSSTNWINLGNTVTATNATMSSSDALRADKQRFYRVVLLP
jgi:streptogramin lyase